MVTTQSSWNPGSLNIAQRMADERIRQNIRMVSALNGSTAVTSGTLTVIGYFVVPAFTVAGTVITCRCSGTIIGDASANLTISFVDKAMSAGSPTTPEGGGGYWTTELVDPGVGPYIFNIDAWAVVNVIDNSTPPQIGGFITLYSSGTSMAFHQGLSSQGTPVLTQTDVWVQIQADFAGSPAGVAVALTTGYVEIIKPSRGATLDPVAQIITP